jgi:hypothetical protein
LTATAAPGDIRCRPRRRHRKEETGLKTYLRMLRMVRPYTGQLVMAVIAMFIFSAASVFSTAMLSPFLETLFLKGDEPAAATAPAPEQAPTLVCDRRHY